MHSTSPDLKFAPMGKQQLNQRAAGETVQRQTECQKADIRKALTLYADWPKCSLAVSGKIVPSLLGCRILI